jgi:dephospho-CoA kinase
MPRRGAAEGPGGARVAVVTGGIGAGKSSFCREVARRPGVALLDADQVAHEALEIPELRSALRRRFGGGIFDHAGQVVRARLAQLAFRDSDERAALEEILHPWIGAELARRVDRLKQDPGVAIVLVEIPLVAEAGVPPWCDRVVLIEAPEAVRLERLRAKGMSREDALRRIREQAGDAARRALADDRIENDDGPLELARRAQAWWRRWTAAGE